MKSHFLQKVVLRKRFFSFAYFLQVVIIFLLYSISAKIGLHLTAVNTFATLIWPPTGIALVALMLFGYQLWIGIFAAAFFVNLSTGAPLLVAAGIGIGNTLEAFVGSYIFRRYGFHQTLETLHDVLMLILGAAIISTAVSATIGVTSLLIGHVVSPASYFSTWSTWWIGDMLGDIIVASFLFAWSLHQFALEKKRLIEKFIVLSLLFLITYIFFSDAFGLHARGSPITYIVFPFLIWIALRFGQKETTAANVFVSIIAIWKTLEGIGPFAVGSVVTNILYLQGFMGIAAVTSMILAATTRERQQAETRKDDFINIASHELKTPVTSIKAYGQFIEKQFQKKKDKKMSYFLKNINTQINRLDLLINAMLDGTRIQAGKMLPHKKPCSIDQLVQKVVVDFQYMNDTHDIQFIGRTEKYLLVDKDAIEQVVSNLLSNAIKYSPKGSKIIVRLKRHNQQITLSIQDFGIGIPEEKKRFIFDRFFRIDEQKSGITGLGLGLFIASEIIKQHKGNIWVESIFRKGSTFFFSLPLNQ